MPNRSRLSHTAGILCYVGTCVDDYYRYCCIKIVQTDFSPEVHDSDALELLARSVPACRQGRKSSEKYYYNLSFGWWDVQLLPSV